MAGVGAAWANERWRLGQWPMVIGAPSSLILDSQAAPEGPDECFFRRHVTEIICLFDVVFRPAAATKQFS